MKHVHQFAQVKSKKKKTNKLKCIQLARALQLIVWLLFRIISLFCITDTDHISRWKILVECKAPPGQSVGLGNSLCIARAVRVIKRRRDNIIIIWTDLYTSPKCTQLRQWASAGAGLGVHKAGDGSISTKYCAQCESHLFEKKNETFGCVQHNYSFR